MFDAELTTIRQQAIPIAEPILTGQQKQRLYTHPTVQMLAPGKVKKVMAKLNYGPNQHRRTVRILIIK